MEQTITFQGKTYPLHVTRKRIRRFIAKTRAGALEISAPLYASEYEIQRMIQQLPASFLKRLEKEQGLGENYVYILGKKYLFRPYGSPKEENTISYLNKENLEKRLKSLALEVITKRVRYYESLMHISPSYHVRVRKMDTRYGTNSRKTHTLTFALTLIHYDEEVIDSIVVHELAHFHHFDHSKAFYEEVYHYFPNYKKAMKRLEEGPGK